MKKLIACILLLPTLAFGICNGSPDDSWHGDDKKVHLGGSAVTSAIIGTQLESPIKGFFWSSAIWSAKEILDARSSTGSCSRKDIIVNIIGAGIGAGGAYYFIQPQPGGLKVTFVKNI